MASGVSYLSEAAPLLSSAGLSIDEQAIDATPHIKNDALRIPFGIRDKCPLRGCAMAKDKYQLTAIVSTAALKIGK